MRFLGISIHKDLKIFFIPGAENSFYPYSLRRQALVFYALVVLAIKAMSLGSGAILPKTNFFAEVSQQMILQLTNQQRQSSGLAMLKESPTLNNAAKQKALDMVLHNYFAHISPEGVTPWFWFKSNGYSYRYAGENLAIDFLGSSDVVNAWMNSLGHRQNILNDKYQEIGVAVVQGMIDGQNTTVVVQMFGAPKLAVSQPIPTPIPTVKLSPAVKPPLAISPIVSAEPVLLISPLPAGPLFTVEPVVAHSTSSGQADLEEQIPIAEPYAGPVITRPSEVAGARTINAWNFLVDTVSDPNWLYWIMLGYLALVMVLGIFSRIYTPQPKAFVGIMLLMVLTATIMAMPDTDQLLQWSVRVL